jgi:hypothetical protein
MRWSFFLNRLLLFLDRPKTVYAPGRRDRLRLYWEARGIGLDFHSLAWERRGSFRWQPHITLKQSNFALPSKHPRWVCDIHSFDSLRGEAILKIGEGDAPDNAPRMKASYSWRRWDLVHNEELDRLRECANPFESFTTGDAGAA